MFHDVRRREREQGEKLGRERGREGEVNMLTGVARLSFRNDEQDAIRKRQGSRRKQSLWRLSARVLREEGWLSPRAAWTKVPVMAGPAQLGWVWMSRCIHS
jgi:hypothetical protein